MRPQFRLTFQALSGSCVRHALTLSVPITIQRGIHEGGALGSGGTFWS